MSNFDFVTGLQGAWSALNHLNLFNAGSGIVEDLIAPLAVEISYDGDHDRGMRFYRLTRMSQNVYNQRNTGEFAAGAFGNLMTFSDTVRSWFDDDFKAGYWSGVNGVREEIITQANVIGDWIHTSIQRIVLARAAFGPEGRIASVDWDGVSADLTSLYQREDVRPVIQSWYQLTRDATADLTPGSDLIGVVDVNGNISDTRAFQSHVLRSLTSPFVDRLRNFQRQGIDVFLGRSPGPLSFDLESLDTTGTPISLNEAGHRTLNEMGALIALILHLEKILGLPS